MQLALRRSEHVIAGQRDELVALAAHSPARSAVAGLLVALALAALAVRAGSGEQADDYLFAALVLAAPWVAGRVARRRQAATAAAEQRAELAVAEERARRLPVRLQIEGDRRPVGGGVGLAAYRVVQEALTNALRHARGSQATVRVSYQPRALELIVTDSGGSSNGTLGTGQGLIGMRERVLVHDGELDAGPLPGGGFCVRARLPSAVIRILIADDQSLVRGGFRMILDAQPDLKVVGEAPDGRSAVRRALELHPDVILMDVRMTELDGLAATRELARAGSPARVLILTTFDLDEYVYEAIKAGASGFLLKDVDPPDLVHSVRAVLRGDALLAPQITRRLVERFARTPQRQPELDELTPRERDVLLSIARGRSNAEIAAELYLSEGTVKTHVTRLLHKLGIRDRVQAVVLAYESGLVTPGETAPQSPDRSRNA